MFLARDDLQMNKVKLATDCCHAAVMLNQIVFFDKTAHGDELRKLYKRWRRRAKKVVLKVGNEEEMYMYNV